MNLISIYNTQYSYRVLMVSERKFLYAHYKETTRVPFTNSLNHLPPWLFSITLPSPRRQLTTPTNLLFLLHQPIMAIGRLWIILSFHTQVIWLCGRLNSMSPTPRHNWETIQIIRYGSLMMHAFACWDIPSSSSHTRDYLYNVPNFQTQIFF